LSGPLVLALSLFFCVSTFFFDHRQRSLCDAEITRAHH
jgi:hypothetical protein